MITCKNEKLKSDNPIKKNEKQNKHEDSKHSEEIKIVLKNGEKWVVDKPMMRLIQNIRTDVMNFNGDSIDKYKTLASKINDNLKILTSSCTMTGQAHDELHKWLVPFLKMSESFSESKTLDVAQKNYQAIKKSFKIVDENFK
jgi:ElaB/YqjD/DUF883 family membrane-anchored ribosome-binding protein